METDTRQPEPTNMTGEPLHQVSPERVNQQRPRDISSGHTRDGSAIQLHDVKLAGLTTVSQQSKQLERRANDAALQRAMLGREEAESEMRKWRHEAENLKRQVPELERRERKVSERLEQYMEKYASTKERHNATVQQLDKEMRKVRKDCWRLQSKLVEEQEKLSSAQSLLKASQAEVNHEKERSGKREQEAFAARYELVGVREELAQMQQQIKLVEQERDALRTIAKAEEVARIAAEGRLPLPLIPEDDEFASPRKPRRSLDMIAITTSAASEEEVDNLTMLVAWEQQRADRACEQVAFLEAEYSIRGVSTSRSSLHAVSTTPSTATPKFKDQIIDGTSQIFGNLVIAQPVFRPEGSMAEMSPWISPEKPDERTLMEPPEDRAFYARTPSCEPPAPAIYQGVNTSLLSLLEAPQSPTAEESGMDTQTSNAAPAIETVHTTSTTTRVPLRSPSDTSATPTTAEPIRDTTMSPMVSREEALAMIRERRGRARSLAQGMATPRKQMIDNGTRRDISAPAVRSGNVRGRSQVRM